jgi:hypothetical protein
MARWEYLITDYPKNLPYHFAVNRAGGYRRVLSLVGSWLVSSTSVKLLHCYT